MCADAVDLDAGWLRVIRTVVEVAGHTRFKGYPKDRRPANHPVACLPGWLVGILREHTEQFGYGEADLLLANRAGGAHRRTRCPAVAAIARAGRLAGHSHRRRRTVVAAWTDDEGNGTATGSGPK